MPLEYVPFDLMCLNDIFTKLNLKSTDIFNYIHHQFCTYIYSKGKHTGLMCCRKSINPIVNNCCSQHLKYIDKNLIKKNKKTNETIINCNKYYKKKEIIYYCNRKGVKNNNCRRRVNEQGEACIYHKRKKEENNFDVNYLRNISIFHVMKYLGYIAIDEGSYKRYIFDNINLVVNKNNQFCDNISKINGGGAIDLLIKIFKYNFKHSISFLKTIFDNKKSCYIDKYNSSSNINVENKIQKKIYKQVPIYDLANIEKVKRYLTKRRKIDKDIINNLIDNKILYSDKYSNCVFLDQNKQYSFIRSTNMVKYVLTNGKPTFFKYKFGDSSNIYLFESIIDALSFRTLHNKDGIYIVTNGNTLINKVSQLEELKSAKTVYLCFDNDEQGNSFDNIVRKNINNNIIIFKSIKKDFNEDLIGK